VSRAFSLTKTPRSMKRAISSVTHIMSPMRRESSVCGLPTIAQTTPRGIIRPSSNLSSLDGSDIDITVCKTCASFVTMKLCVVFSSSIRKISGQHFLVRYIRALL